MEANNLLADHLHIGGPVFLVLCRVVRAVAERRDVVGQRIEPDVDHVLGIVRNRNAPGEGAAADGKIAQAGAHERNHFIAPRFRDG